MKNMRIALIILGLGFSSLGAQAYVGTDLQSGEAIHFGEAKDKTTVVVFLSAKCPCSASHEASLKALHERFTSKGFEFIAVHSNQDEAREMTLAHFGAAKLPFPVIEDQGSKLSNELKALKTPHAFILKEGKVVYEGGVDDSADASHATEHFLENALNEISQNKPVTLARARALGCVIKR